MVGVCKIAIIDLSGSSRPSGQPVSLEPTNSFQTRLTGATGVVEKIATTMSPTVQGDAVPFDVNNRACPSK